MSKRKETQQVGASSSKRTKTVKPTEDPTHIKPPFVPNGFNQNRARLVSSYQEVELNNDGKCVILWMSRDQRVKDNHALFYAQATANAKNVPLVVIFNLVPKFLEATLRQYSFMITGLKEVEEELRKLSIPFHLLEGNPLETIPAFAKEKDPVLMVTDFSPLRIGRQWTEGVSEKLLDNNTFPKPIPLVQVDAHNIVPCWIASPKLEYGARTIRSKIQSKINEYLTEIPEPTSNPPGSLKTELIDWDAALSRLEIDRTVKEVAGFTPGTKAAFALLDDFIANRLKIFADKRNDPNIEAASNLSPYIHFGQISVQKIVMHLKSLRKYPASVDMYVEEAVVRRELSDNFCYYNPLYDSLEGCNDWAKESLRIHRDDKREFIYSRQELEEGMTHDELWNAAQIQMTKEGKMHGFLRMYWAKKILEWTPSPEEALSIALWLNDKYELDGRDPNGYVGCMWSIGGIHDQGWAERPVFGKIRFMNYKGCQRKFDVKSFVARYPPAAKNAIKVNTKK